MTEIERQIQVEEEWGRRKVMQPIQNSERLVQYEARKGLWRCFPASANVPTRYATVIPFAMKEKS